MCCLSAQQIYSKLGNTGGDRVLQEPLQYRSKHLVSRGRSVQEGQAKDTRYLNCGRSRADSIVRYPSRPAFVSKAGAFIQKYLGVTPKIVSLLEVTSPWAQALASARFPSKISFFRLAWLTSIIPNSRFQRWKGKYAGMGIRELRRLKQLDEENASLKKLVDEPGQTHAAGSYRKKVINPARKKASGWWKSMR